MTRRPQLPERPAMDPISRRALLRTGAVGGGAAGLALLGAPLGAAEPVAAATADAGRQPLLTALGDTIIPATDTPGAAEAGVADFVAMMVERWMHPDERARFLAGLDSFDATVRRSYGQPFAALPPARRLEILQAMAAAEEGTAAGTPPAEGPFLARIRALAIYGYYTSEAGASQELELNLVPGHYEPCHDLQPGERAVSLGRNNAVLRMP